MRSNTIYFPGVDVGTSSTRALLLDERGVIVSSAPEEHAPFVSPSIGWAEQEPEDWWRACCVAVKRALAAANLRGDDVACVDFSGQMHRAALLAGVGAEAWRTVGEAASAAVCVAEGIEPGTRAAETLNASYVAYRRMFPATQKIFMN
jgi:sugar (pentulose or hexulose) kinase